MKNVPILEIKNLSIEFNNDSSKTFAVNDVSFTLCKGEILGIVGESGSGKSTIAHGILQLLPTSGKITKGSIKFNNIDLTKLNFQQLQKIRGHKITYIPQNPSNAFNPVRTIESQFKEIFDNQKNKTDDISVEESNNVIKKQPTEKIAELLKLVGIKQPLKYIKQYPFELSNGLLQRIIIAMSLACKPDLIIADEPTTALDVTVQAQILNLFQLIQKKFNISIIIITHDLGVIAKLCNRIIVMYSGYIMEKGSTDDILYHSNHEYTKNLILSTPSLDESKILKPINGIQKNLTCLPNYCVFSNRCNNCMTICTKYKPSFFKINDVHQTTCFKYILELYEQNIIDEEEMQNIIQKLQNKEEI